MVFVEISELPEIGSLPTGLVRTASPVLKRFSLERGAMEASYGAPMAPVAVLGRDLYLE
jgi:hypothetical protein